MLEQKQLQGKRSQIQTAESPLPWLMQAIHSSVLLSSGATDPFFDSAGCSCMLPAVASKKSGTTALTQGCPFAGCPFAGGPFAGRSLFARPMGQYFLKRSSLALRISPFVVPGSYMWVEILHEALWEIFKAAACLAVQATIILFSVPGPGICCMYDWFLPPPTLKEAVWILVVAPPANLAFFGMCLVAGLLQGPAFSTAFVAGFFKSLPAFSLQSTLATGGGLSIRLPMRPQSEELSSPSSLLVFNIAGMAVDSTVTSLMWVVSSLLGFWADLQAPSFCKAFATGWNGFLQAYFQICPMQPERMSLFSNASVGHPKHLKPCQVNGHVPLPNVGQEVSIPNFLQATSKLRLSCPYLICPEGLTFRSASRSLCSLNKAFGCSACWACKFFYCSKSKLAATPMDLM